MLTNKFTPLQIRHMERASRAAIKEKKRIAKNSTHRSNYRWSSDVRHELRVYNAKPVEKFSVEATLRELEEQIKTAEDMLFEIKQEELEELAVAEREKKQELAYLLEKSFISEEFMEKLFEEIE